MSLTKTQLSDMKSKNTISGAKGVTFNGEEFIVPETHDMVKTLFDPTVRKSNFEILILLALGSNSLIFWLIKDNSLRIAIFTGLYFFWRFSYNFGIGYMLHHQSKKEELVKIAKYNKVFEKNSNSLLAKSIQAEIKSQMGGEYEISSYPLEFNTWLIFRKVVDLILMLDFTTFICLVVACSINNDYEFIRNQSSWIVVSRILAGVVLILFNLWVKVNAHNTIKDYAWYWGDFFFRQFNNEELIFDGVFEMVPHPMYSVGYVGYYGFALISKSYTVLVVALFGHFLQMIFLHYIENPHIDKIYGPSSNEIDIQKVLKLKDLKNFDNLKPLVGLYNFNFLRASDLGNLIIVFTYGIILPFIASLSANHKMVGNLLFILTVVIKVFESLSIDVLLILQSYYQTFTKWYILNDIPVEKSLNNWALIYNFMINLTYSSFFGLNLFHILIGGHEIHAYEWFRLRCFLGLSLILTQVWINASIIDSIGYFGWFYGDFFIAKPTTQLTKAGVYRYLNNPEQFFGVCGVMGVTIINPSVENITCCLLWVLNNFLRINFIEKLHMIKIYGKQEVLKDSGVTKTLKKHLLPDAIQRRFSEGESKRRNSLTDSLDAFMKELRKSNTKLTKQNVIELSQDLNFENSDYKIKINTQNIKIGTPIEVEFYSAEGTSPKDWIGLYKVVQTSYSRYKTLISSFGRWSWCNPDENKIIFDGNKLFWEEGIYEFRYHLNGKHDVAYISEPFEIKAHSIEIVEDEVELANSLKSKIFDRIVTIDSIDDSINEVVNKCDNILKTYTVISNVVSLSTECKINSKIFLDDSLTIRKLSRKLIDIKKVLDNLSHIDYVDENKKSQ